MQIVSPGMANPATLSYVRDVALPYATDHGIELHELRKVRRDGTVEALHGRLVRPGSRSLPIPVPMSDTGAPGTRACTLDIRIRVIGRWLRQHGASRTDPATVAVGFSTDACLNRRTSALATARADLSLRALRARSTVPSTLSPAPDVTERAAISTWGMTPMCLLEDLELDARLARSVSGSLTA